MHPAANGRRFILDKVIGYGAGAMCLELENVGKTYRSGWLQRVVTPVLAGVGLHLAPGQTIEITGPSGAGKTTLGLIIAGMLKPDRGVVRLRGTDLWALSPRDRKARTRRLQIVFQHPEITFNPRWTMARSLAEPWRLNKRRAAPAELVSRLEEVQLDAAVLERRPHQFSGGELQRIAIARTMVVEPSMVVLGEPTAMLDALTQAHILTLLERIQRRTGVCLVLISHDHKLVGRFSHRVYRLANGALQATNTAKDMGTDGLVKGEPPSFGA
jgi:peptide/nickel transport system ATP-binding protein